ncbi:MAG: helix-turn-helix transcriptional regulator [Clostridia bacterium]|nr:helix-turn-helix transcriptional regulator [Clostridia bacterium]
MLKNNIELDIKTKCMEEQVTQAKVAGKVGITKSYVNKIVRNREQIIIRTFLAIREELGYDVRLTYERRENAK